MSEFTIIDEIEQLNVGESEYFNRIFTLKSSKLSLFNICFTKILQQTALINKYFNNSQDSDLKRHQHNVYKLNIS